MKKCFIIHVLKKEKMEFLQSINAVFETRDLAKGYIHACDREKYTYIIQEVEYITQ